MTKKLTAEFLGTFWLVFGGCGSAVLAAAFPSLGIGFAGVSLAFGLTVLTMAYAVGGISGGHFNPAVSISFMQTIKIRQTHLIGVTYSLKCPPTFRVHKLSEFFLLIVFDTLSKLHRPSRLNF